MDLRQCFGDALTLVNYPLRHASVTVLWIGFHFPIILEVRVSPREHEIIVVLFLECRQQSYEVRVSMLLLAQVAKYARLFKESLTVSFWI